ncbi:MAG: hypothetical protein IPL32_18850 [Chloracidobacterium sp.]|nr:hypothetical protein [Chloracidobacterium sp.]
MRYPPDRLKVREALETQSQKTRNERKTLEKTLEIVEQYTGKQINKRLCTFIQEKSGQRFREVTRWDSETKKNETKSEAYPCIYATLEKKDYGEREYTLTVYNEWAERSTIWFADMPDLIEGIKARISGTDEAIVNISNLLKNLDNTLDRFEKATTELEEINDIKGMFYIRELL